MSLSFFSSSSFSHRDRDSIVEHDNTNGRPILSSIESLSWFHQCWSFWHRLIARINRVFNLHFKNRKERRGKVQVKVREKMKRNTGKRNQGKPKFSKCVFSGFIKTKWNLICLKKKYHFHRNIFSKSNKKEKKKLLLILKISSSLYINLYA